MKMFMNKIKSLSVIDFKVLKNLNVMALNQYSDFKIRVHQNFKNLDDKNSRMG